MLGMIFGDINGSAEDVTHNNLKTTQLRRDTARCLATEMYYDGRKAFAIDNHVGQSCRCDRHVRQSSDKINLTDPILLLSLTGSVRQICLDQFGLYWPTGMMLCAALSTLIPSYGLARYYNWGVQCILGFVGRYS
jgi:hypothetical protein